METQPITLTPEKLRELQLAQLDMLRFFKQFCEDNHITFFVSIPDEEKKTAEENFKKCDGFKRSLELSAQYGLYRQNYCGCEFSRQQ